MSEQADKKSKVSERKIKMFRCYYDPSVGPKSRLAFSRAELSTWSFEFHPIGIYVKVPYVNPSDRSKDYVTEHLIPFNNIQNITLMPEDKVEKSKSADLQVAA